MKGAFKLKLLLFSFILAIGVAFISRLFTVRGIIGWKETGIAAAIALMVCHLVTLLFIKENKRRIVARRYILIAGLLAAALFYNDRKHKLVCSVVATKMNPRDSTLSNFTKNIITGTKLKEEKITDATVKMNRESKCDLFNYMTTHDPGEIWTAASVRNSTTQLFISYLAVVLFLVALLTHLLEEIFFSDVLTKLDKRDHVFISYNHDNKKTAEAINQALRQKKIKTLLDTANMTGGDDIGSFIRESIQSAGVTLLIVSEKSLLSGWVATETINTFFLEMYENDKSFIACYLDDSFLDPAFTNRSLRVINEKIELLNKQIDERNSLGSDSRDLNDQKTRLYLLKNNLDKIIQRLQNSMCIDIGNAKFDEYFPAVARAITAKLKGR